jgi:transcriptional antiterminator
VFHLYFEQHLSATAIAEELGVNRNTVYADIEYLHEELASAYDPADIRELMQRQLKRLDSQRARLFTYLEQADDHKEKMTVERRIFEIDIQIARIAGSVYRGAIWPTI